MVNGPTMRLVDPTIGLAACTVCGATHFIRFRRGYKADGWAWYCLKRIGHGKPAGWKSPRTEITKNWSGSISKNTSAGQIVKDGMR